MISNLKLYGAIVVLVVMVALGATVKILWDERSSLKDQLAQSQAQTRAVEEVAQKAAERAVTLNPIRTEIARAPDNGCVGPGVRAALDGLRSLQPRSGQP